MKTVYYEVLEFEGELLKNIYYYAHNNILDSKYNAERYYGLKIKQAQLNKSAKNFKMVFAIIEDYQTTRHILSDKDSKAHELEAMILSGMTGRQIEIPEWSVREVKILENL